LFYKHFPRLIDLGHIYIARPPLFRVDAPARGKKPAQKIYALDSSELIAIEDKLRKDGVREAAWQISRFKGLGEMSAEQLWDTTLNPDTRRLLPVILGQLSALDTCKTMDMLMGKTESAARRDWLEDRGNEVEADI
jgi:topoisomerase-4 subunit B